MLSLCYGEQIPTRPQHFYYTARSLRFGGRKASAGGAPLRRRQKGRPGCGALHHRQAAAVGRPTLNWPCPAAPFGRAGVYFGYAGGRGSVSPAEFCAWRCLVVALGLCGQPVCLHLCVRVCHCALGLQVSVRQARVASVRRALRRLAADSQPEKGGE